MRTETQARDVFDCYYLIQIQTVDLSNTFTINELQIAIDNAMGINFAMFKAQVVSFLESEYQAQYSDEHAWDSMLLYVCDYLTSLNHG